MSGGGKKVRKSLLELLLAAIIICPSLKAQKIYSYDTVTPLNVPVLYEHGIITTDNTNEFGITFSPDGKEVFFTRQNFREEPLMKIYHARYEKGMWTNPEVAPFSGQYEDNDPMFSPDGQTLFFCSKRPTPQNPEKRDFDIWMVKRTSGGWSKPIHLGESVNVDGYDDLFVSVTQDGTLYFASNRPASYGEMDIFRARVQNGKYLAAENIGNPVNSEAREANPFVSRDEKMLIFYSDRPGGFGWIDLYISFNEGGKWSPPVNLGEVINTPDLDFSPYISPNGKYFFFARRKNKIVNLFQVNIDVLPRFK
ncbi:MAG: hypothetical protein D6748_06155 [Calditrichaeota bacterium]|nr:MAG: hypothetical protein D6748_06155 [Calditrichota bacterium]